MRIRVRVSNHQQFGRLARRLRQAADGGLRDDLATGLQRAAAPVVPKIQARVRRASFPAMPRRRGGRSTGFRGRLADAVKVRPLAAPPGVRFTVDGATVSPDNPSQGHRLALYSDGWSRRRWRHPTFDRPRDDPDTWFNQTPTPWFAAAIDPEGPRFSRAVEQAMEKTARRVLR